MKNFIKTFLVAALLVGFTTNTQAQRNNQNNGQQPPRIHQMGQYQNFGPMQGARQLPMFTLLNLTEEQQEQFKQHRIEGQKAMLPLRNELREKNARLQTLTTGSDYDASAVNTLIQEIGDLKTKMMIFHESHQRKLRSYLTDEQKVIFDTHRGNRGSRGMRGTGRGGNFCPGFQR